MTTINGGKPTLKQKIEAEIQKSVAQHLYDAGQSKSYIAKFLNISIYKVSRMKLIDKKHDNEKAN